MRLIMGVLSLFWKLYIAIVFTITAFIFFPFIFPLLFSDNNKKRSFKVFVVWGWTFRILCFYHVNRVKNEELPDGPFIVVANHISYLDIFLMYSILPKNAFLFLGKSEILKYPIIGTYFRRLNIPVFRDSRVKAAKSLIQAGREVQKGWSLIIFPEGGIPDENPKMDSFKGGAFQLAKGAKVPIVPMTFTNNHRLFSDPTFILGPAYPGISKVYIHAFLSVEEIDGMTHKELRELCYKTINQPLLDEYPEIESTEN